MTCACKTCVEVRRRIEVLAEHGCVKDERAHWSSAVFCGPCSSGSYGQGCALDRAETEKEICDLRALLEC